MTEHGRAMNRMGWMIALAGAWALAALGVVGVTYHDGGSQPDCLPGFYLSSAGWCVRDPQPTDSPDPQPQVALVGMMSGRAEVAGRWVVVGGAGPSVGPLGIEPRTEGL